MIIPRMYFAHTIIIIIMEQQQLLQCKWMRIQKWLLQFSPTQIVAKLSFVIFSKGFYFDDVIDDYRNETQENL
jgi:hypothetical protein